MNVKICQQLKNKQAQLYSAKLSNGMFKMLHNQLLILKFMSNWSNNMKIQQHEVKIYFKSKIFHILEAFLSRHSEFTSF